MSLAKIGADEKCVSIEPVDIALRLSDGKSAIDEIFLVKIELPKDNCVFTAITQA